MSLLDITTGILLIAAGSGMYAGLDKLAGSMFFLLLLAASLFFNNFCRFIARENNWPEALLVQRGIGRIKARAILKTAGAIAVLAVCLYLLISIYWLTLGFNLSVYDSFNSRIFYLAVHLFLVFYAVFAVRTMQTHKETNTSAQWYRSLGYLSLYQSVIFVLFILTSYIPEADSDLINKAVDYGFFSVFVILALLSAEILTATIRSIRITATGEGQSELPVPFFISFFAAEESIKRSLVRSIETISGVDVARSEIVAFGLNILEPVLIITLFAVWLTSAIVIIPPDKEAIFRQFGQISNAASAKPGLHFKLPWPFSTAELFEPYKIRTINIGFEPDPNQRHIIWTKAHAVNYFHLIVGDGVEVIAIDCQIMYRINNLYKYITSMQNPEEFISAAAYKFLTLKTVSARFDEIITRDRKMLADQLKIEIQTAIDAANMGVSLVEIVFLAMHPPIEVAEAYEDVISAQIDKVTYVLKANTENTHKIFMSRATARGQEFDARSQAANTFGRATGEAASFISRTAGFEVDPDLERFRLRLDRIQTLLGSKPIYVVDKSLMRSKDTMYLNLQTW